MKKNCRNRALLLLLALLTVFSVFSARVFAASSLNTGVTGVSLVYEKSSTFGSANGSAADGVCTIKATGYKRFSSYVGKATVTITNSLAETATLSFDWSATLNGGSLTIGGTKQTATSGSYSQELAAGGKVTLELASAKGSSTSTLVLKNFACTVKVDSSDITVSFDDTLGAVTVGSTSLTSGSTTSITEDTVFTASPKNGASFLGWIDPDTNLVKCSTASYTVPCGGDQNLRAVFTTATSNAWFHAGTYLYNDLTTAAKSGASTVILAHDGILPAGNYTIPSGVTLLIPKDSSHTLCTTRPEVYNGLSGDGSSANSAYRTLTMASGANITVASGGAISISAQQYATSTQVTSKVYGAYGEITMQGGSNIAVQSGGNLYAWGYISRYASGSEGTVSIKSGGTVYEMFQTTGYRGGSITGDEYDNDKGVFILNQYYVQNVEVPMTLEAGAAEKCVFSVAYNALVATATETAEFDFMGSTAGMFRFTKGSITKDYDEANDRLICTVNTGSTISLSNIEISIKVAALVDIDMNSSNYVLPITNNIDIIVDSQSTVTMTQDMALLPGATLTINSGSTLDMGSNALYVYDLDGWGNYAYAGQTHKRIPYVAAGSPAARSLSDAQMNVNGTFTGTLYSVGGHANIYGTGTITQTANSGVTTYQYDQSASAYTEIKATPAVLQHGDGTYLATASLGGGDYIYSNGKWHKLSHEDGVAATCTEDGKLEHYLCDDCQGWFQDAGAVTQLEDITIPAGHIWDYSAGKCTNTCGAAIVTYQTINLNLRDQVYLQFHYTVHEDFKDKLIVHVSEAYNGLTLNTELGVGNEWSAALREMLVSGGQYIISQGIAAGEMTGAVKVWFTVGDQTVYTTVGDAAVDSVSKTVKDYLAEGVVSSDTQLQNLCQAAAMFGGYAQKFYLTNTDNLANIGLNEQNYTLTQELIKKACDDVAKYKITVGVDSIGITATSQKVNLDSDMYIRVYFTFDNGYAPTDFTFTITYPTDRGNGVETQEGFTLDEENGRYYIDIPNVPVAYWNDNYTITVTRTADSKTYAVSTSVMAWVNSCIHLSMDPEQKLMAVAMWNFAEAADKYFTEGEA